VVGEGDVIKIDFGTQIEGRIIDCAFTAYFQDRSPPLFIFSFILFYVVGSPPWCRL